MEKKCKRAIALGVISASVFAIAIGTTVFENHGGNILLGKAVDEPYMWKLKSDIDNAVITHSSSYKTDSVTLKTPDGNDIKFQYADLKIFKGVNDKHGWQTMKAGSYFTNSTAIHGLVKITLKFDDSCRDKNFKIYYSGDKNFTEDYSASFTTETDLTEFEFGGRSPNYFKVVAVDGEIHIGSMYLYYSCGDSYKKLTVTPNNDNYGSVKTDHTVYLPGDEVTAKAKPQFSYMFDGYYAGSTLLSSNSEYTFDMPANDYAIEAKFVENPETSVGRNPEINTSTKKVVYGIYPQTLVTDSSIIEALNGMSSANYGNYYFYNDYCYIKSTAKYPTMSEFNNGDPITVDSSYWFKVEPVTWNIVSSGDGKYMLFSENIIDGSHYHKDDVAWQASGYWDSDVDTLLNGKMLDNMFILGKDQVINSTVDCSLATTNNPDYSGGNYYLGSKLRDLFSLSYQDLANTELFADANSRSTPYVTDYARCRGGNEEYWSRSSSFHAASFDGNYVTYVDSSGNIHDIRPDYGYKGVRPAMYIPMGE